MLPPTEAFMGDGGAAAVVVLSAVSGELLRPGCRATTDTLSARRSVTAGFASLLQDVDGHDPGQGSGLDTKRVRLVNGFRIRVERRGQMKPRYRDVACVVWSAQRRPLDALNLLFEGV